MKLIIIGYGAVSSAVLPLLINELRDEIKSLKIIAPSVNDKETKEQGLRVTWAHQKLTKYNYRSVLKELDDETFLINLSVDVSSLDLIALCHENNAMYLDTCIEPWAGHYTDPSIPPANRTNYSLRESMLALKRALHNGPTAIIAHGANPGLVSHFAKQALLNISQDLHPSSNASPITRQDWARLAWQLNIKTIHVAEHDTQVADKSKNPGEFLNTWSVDGFIGEGCQPSELGWGTHEQHLPDDGHFHTTSESKSIYLNRPGASVRVKTWTPAYGPCLGLLITHNEALSLSEYLTYKDDRGLIYRPTVHYAYHPCNDAILSIHELSGNFWQPQPRKRVLRGDEIVYGSDYLGVLLMGHEKNAYWYGSVLENSTAQRLNPQSSATTLQVAAGVLAGVKWAIANPKQGLVEAEEIDFRLVLEVAQRYLGDMVGAYTDWTPFSKSKALFPNERAGAGVDEDWQFANFLE
ncbi:saccharopine dehydrogenase C-terminal domain-containing protein [Pseudomonas putida]|uniref:saccharopine dehydrogenase C-terminal domain-containing protein n=1 Tax=Pseudomonas putida TaxID=303 RepID=UPI001F51591D|nr:saccharopine dehydrogenase C-terminal domain-containing protein [Pseudomonas putida]MCI0912853.1 homospermidine synthase [Pseudomonas putida]